MNRKKVVLGIGVAAAVLALSLSAFAALHVALLPGSATLNVAGPTTQKTFDAFCNFTPCNITWVLVLSNSDVGSIDNTSGDRRPRLPWDRQRALLTSLPPTAMVT